MANETEKKPFATISVPTEIKAERIIDLICCGFEGGINYWAVLKSKKKPKTPCPFTDGLGESWDKYCYWYPLVEGGSLQLEDSEDSGEVCKPLNKETIIKGLQIMAEKYPWHFADFLKENDDATTADVFIQCCVFGDIVYG